MDSQSSIDYSSKSNFVSIQSSRIHYVDKKACSECGTVFLFLHGNPTSSYIWRNIIPHLTSIGRCVAPDLIGFGKSGKPDIEYTFRDHYEYIKEFIELLDLDNIILVLHDWGGAIGFHYARLHPEKIKGIVFMETIYKPMEWDSLDPFARWLFRKFQNDKAGYFLNGRLNLFLRFILPFSMNRRLTKGEQRTYMEPFTTVESRKPIIKFPQELPFRGSGTENEKVANDYYSWLKQTKVPKLLLYANPGVQIKKANVQELKESLPNLTVQDLGKGKHFIQEDEPNKIGIAVQNWFKGIQIKLEHIT